VENKKTKIAAVIFLILLAIPIYLLSPPGMARLVNMTLSDAKLNDPENPAHMYKLAMIYNYTGREDECDHVLEQFILRYGGDETNLDDARRYFVRWQNPAWLADPSNMRHTNYPNNGPGWIGSPPAHPLISKVVLLYALHLDDHSRHDVGKFLRSIVVERFADDPNAIKDAKLGIDRDKQRNY
jgi:hypothetical protein